ncbi:hypothetical protein CHLRE_14g625000v5 [Chlamydomonas reinhardtii]|uniref:Stress-response A/B barrel domain-containing protein n=1 Tax=Chlamydomonas reinhardtii TaxID=3055 RepID=A0A2K3CY98_CHLRE|nr:uncharacterized protein CHLRE_14g625000v5 [Chlamydomonas reinhardtii]PNW73251.1 hypothetical protein CHLRE_14g625000v5 [Chlamydomonas reinhardtii]
MRALPSSRCAHAPLQRQHATRALGAQQWRARVLTHSARADTVPVWETLVTVSNDGTQSSDEQQELVDTLWSLQYRTPGACCASAGPVVQSVMARDSDMAPRAAVYYRFSSQAQAERFVAGPAFADAKARLLGSAAVSLSLWKVMVPNDMEALFKRGPAFDVGVDLVLMLEPAAAVSPAAAEAAVAAAEGSAAPAAAAVPMDVVVDVVGRMQRAALALSAVQVSCGQDVMALDSRFVWMGRFPQEEAAQRFLRSPVVQELVAAAAAASPDASKPALALTSAAIIEVGAVDQSKQGRV